MTSVQLIKNLKLFESVFFAVSEASELIKSSMLMLKLSVQGTLLLKLPSCLGQT